MKILAAGLLLLSAVSAHAAKPPADSDAPRRTALDRLCEKGRKGKLYLADLVAMEKRFPQTLTAQETAAFEPYYACRRMAGAAKSCAMLKSLPAERGDLQRQCLKESAEALLVYAIIKGQPAGALCESFIKETRVEILPGKAEAFCGVYERAVASGKLSCSELAGVLPPKRVEGCERYTAYIHGDPKLCPAGEGASQRECRRMAELVGTLRSRSAEACSRLPFCGALSGQTLSCEKIGEESSALFRKRLDQDLRCSAGPEAQVETDQTKARREIEQADWAKKDQAQEAAADERKKEDARNAEALKAKMAEYERRRKLMQEREDATHLYKKDEPMEIPQAPKAAPAPPAPSKETP